MCFSNSLNNNMSYTVKGDFSKYFFFKWNVLAFYIQSYSPMFLQLYSTSLQIRDSFLLVRDRIITTLDLALQIGNILLQVPDWRVLSKPISASYFKLKKARPFLLGFVNYIIIRRSSFFETMKICDKYQLRVLDSHLPNAGAVLVRIFHLFDNRENFW